MDIQINGVYMNYLEQSLSNTDRVLCNRIRTSGITMTQVQHI